MECRWRCRILVLLALAFLGLACLLVSLDTDFSRVLELTKYSMTAFNATLGDALRGAGPGRAGGRAADPAGPPAAAAGAPEPEVAEAPPPAPAAPAAAAPAAVAPAAGVAAAAAPGSGAEGAPGAPAAAVATQAASAASAVEAACRCVQAGGASPPAALTGGGAGTEEPLQALLAEMRREFRFFAYPAADARTCLAAHHDNRGYEAEQTFYRKAMASPMRVTDAGKATAFFLPTFTSCWRWLAGRNRSAGGRLAARKVHDLVEKAAREYPFFRRYRGRRHFWLSTHDMGKGEAAACARPALAANASCLTNGADEGEEARRHEHCRRGELEALAHFNARQDVSLVCNADVELARQALGSDLKPDARREFSVFFAGSLQGPFRGLRARLFASIKRTGAPKREGSISAEWNRHRLSSRHLSAKEYQRYLASSDLCLAPRGTRVWSPRLFEMLWFGCIPVVVADGYYLPGSCFFNWSSLTVRLPEVEAADAGPVLARLQGDSQWLVDTRRRLLAVRRHLLWSAGATDGDAFELAMLDVYLKLQRRCSG